MKEKEEKVCGNASLTMSLRISSWNFNMTRWRVVIGVLRQAGKACLAEETAALNSSFVVKGT